MSKFSALFCLFLLALPLAAQTAAVIGNKTSASAQTVAKPTATFHTTAGSMTCELFPDKVPNGVANFVGLATGSKTWKNPKTGKTMMHTPLYDGTIFHRVIPNFMIQGGDPLGDGTGGPGFEMADEIVPTLTFDVPGKLAYANSGPNTNGSQFFITEVPTPHLNGHYVIIGQCDDASVELVKKIARMPRDERNDRPEDPVRINSITITGIKAAAAIKPVHKTKARMNADKLAQAQK